MLELAATLFPICRSLTGSGVRQTLGILAQRLPLEVQEVPSGTAIFDWEVPREWRIRDAYIKDASGQRIVDFRSSNLHVVGYSVPVRKTIRWSELKAHLYTLPDHPEWVPYRTSYSTETWGFCLTHRQFLRLEAQGEREYEICIDSALEQGSLTYGEVTLPGETDDEVLISTHICHPSLANDNLSGIAVAAYLAQELQQRQLRYSYRFLFVPVTYGAITWLWRNQESVHRVQHGWVLSGVGDSGVPTYKRSRRGTAPVDRAFAHVLKHRGDGAELRDFEPFGYDERQFCSPGFNLPMGCLMRTPNQQYPEYHTSADNLDFIRPESMFDTWSICLRVIEILEGSRHFVSRFPYCEPRLAPRGLYQPFVAGQPPRELQNALLWVLNLCDGQHTLLDIAERAKLPFAAVQQAAELLQDHELITPLDLCRSAIHSKNEPTPQTALL
jgi:aminopeptidase-like protein